MEFTVEANKERQSDIGSVAYIDREQVKLYLHIYKRGVVTDINNLTFENREKCMEHIESLIKTTNYKLISFTNERKTDDYNERYFVCLRK